MQWHYGKVFLMKNKLKKGYLQWRCRRGTKELDVLLNRFLDTQYDQLSKQELQQFDLLLDTQDTLLWYWLSGQSTSENLTQQAMIEKINAKA